MTLLDTRPVTAPILPGGHVALVAPRTDPSEIALGCLDPDCASLRIILDADEPTELVNARVAYHLDRRRGWLRLPDGRRVGQVLDSTGDALSFRLIHYDDFGFHPLLNPRGLVLGARDGWPIP
jgi:hypothetical protein